MSRLRLVTDPSPSGRDIAVAMVGAALLLAGAPTRSISAWGVAKHVGNPKKHVNTAGLRHVKEDISKEISMCSAKHLKLYTLPLYTSMREAIGTKSSAARRPTWHELVEML